MDTKLMNWTITSKTSILLRTNNSRLQEEEDALEARRVAEELGQTIQEQRYYDFISRL